VTLSGEESGGGRGGYLRRVTQEWEGDDCVFDELFYVRRQDRK